MGKIKKEVMLLDYHIMTGDTKCGIQIIREKKKPPVVICSQLPRVTKGSIQVSYELIRDKVTAKIKSKPSEIVWIEHWPNGSTTFFKEPMFFKVELDKENNPEWHRLSEEEVQTIIGLPSK